MQPAIPTETGFLGSAPPRGLASLCTGHCSTCEAQGMRAMPTGRRPLPPPGFPAVPLEKPSVPRRLTSSEGFARSGAEPNVSRHELTAAIQPLCRFPPSRVVPVSGSYSRHPSLVRFYGQVRINPRAPPLVWVLANSFGFQPCGRISPGGALLAFASTRKGSTPPGSSAHRLPRGLPGFPNPVRSPRLRASASGTV